MAVLHLYALSRLTFFRLSPETHGLDWFPLRPALSLHYSSPHIPLPPSLFLVYSALTPWSLSPLQFPDSCWASSSPCVVIVMLYRLATLLPAEDPTQYDHVEYVSTKSRSTFAEMIRGVFGVTSKSFFFVGRE